MPSAGFHGGGSGEMVTIILAPTSKECATCLKSATPSAMLPNCHIRLSRTSDAMPTRNEISADASGPPNNCFDISFDTGNCVPLLGNLGFLDKQLSWVQVPDGFICTLFQDSGCIDGGKNEEVVLQDGTRDLTNAPGLTGPTNFNDLTSSFSCSPF
ncbi:hypothetical protein B0H13DRAFT_1900867 [Mycena leptocephala]|nr:hypothetical protein B0H13DRAFT_1900867 [Mycena leptocephala]